MRRGQAGRSTPTPRQDCAATCPATLPTLVGRDAELATLAALVDAHRLVTLTGAGGVGKTLLALHVAKARGASTAHGACVVALAPLATDDEIVPAITTALGLPLDGGDPLDALGRALAPLDLFLVLDNAEHLVAGVAAAVTTIAHRAPRVRVLATSQLPLRVTGEQVLRLGVLEVPTGVYDARPRSGDALRGGCAVRRAGATGRSTIRTGRHRRGGRDRHRAAPGWPAPGARTRGRPCAVAWCGGGGRAPRRALAPACARRPRRRGAPSVVARTARLEPRPPGGAGAASLPPARGIRGRLCARTRAGRGNRRHARPLGRRGRAAGAGGPLARRRGQRRAAALSPARIDPRVRTRASAGERRGSGGAAAARMRDA